MPSPTGGQEVSYPAARSGGSCALPVKTGKIVNLFYDVSIDFLPLLMDILSDELSVAGIRVSASGRVTYPEDYGVYGERFGKKPRSIREWVATGKRAGELPPLHDPAALVIWWRRCKKTRVPPEILALSFEGTETGKRSEMTGKISDDGAEKKRVSALGDDQELAGAEESLRQARELANDAYVNLKRALDQKDALDAEMWRKDWTSAVETQRKWEKDFNRIQEDRGLLVRKNEMAVEIASLANTLQRGFLASMVGLLKNHCPAMPDNDRRRLAIAERDRCFEVLQHGGFSENLFCDV